VCRCALQLQLSIRSEPPLDETTDDTEPGDRQPSFWVQVQVGWGRGFVDDLLLRLLRLNPQLFRGIFAFDSLFSRTLWGFTYTQ